MPEPVALDDDMCVATTCEEFAEMLDVLASFVTVEDTLYEGD